MADRERQEKETPTTQDRLKSPVLPDDPLEKILGIFDDDISDLSTSVRDTMDEFHKQQAKDTD